MPVLPLAALIAAQAFSLVSPPAEETRIPRAAEAQVLVQIIRAAAITDGQTDEHHQRRRGMIDGVPGTLLEFE